MEKHQNLATGFARRAFGGRLFVPWEVGYQTTFLQWPPVTSERERERSRALWQLHMWFAMLFSAAMLFFHMWFVMLFSTAMLFFHMCMVCLLCCFLLSCCSFFLSLESRRVFASKDFVSHFVTLYHIFRIRSYSIEINYYFLLILFPLITIHNLFPCEWFE